MTTDELLLAHFKAKIAEHNKAAADHRLQAETYQLAMLFAEKAFAEAAKRGKTGGEVPRE